MAFDFPNAPAIDEEFKPVGGPTYRWTGTAWYIGPAPPPTGRLWTPADLVTRPIMIFTHHDITWNTPGPVGTVSGLTAPNTGEIGFLWQGGSNTETKIGMEMGTSGPNNNTVEFFDNIYGNLALTTILPPPQHTTMAVFAVCNSKVDGDTPMPLVTSVAIV